MNAHGGLSRGLFQRVMRGLDPRIHLLREKFLQRWMDCRVKPGNDDLSLPPPRDASCGSANQTPLAPAAIAARLPPHAAVGIFIVKNSRETMAAHFATAGLYREFACTRAVTGVIGS